MGSTSQISGLVSGLDTASIISQLMQVESQPQTLLKNRVFSEQTRISSLQTVNSKLAAIASKATDLAKMSSWSPVKATSSNAGVTVTASSSAAPGSLTFTVGATATRAQATFADVASLDSVVSTSPLTIHFDDPTKSDVTVDVGDGKLQTVASALNASGFQASLVKAGVDSNGNDTYRLSVAGQSTGANSGFTITAGSVGLLGGVQTTASTQDFADTAAASTDPVTSANGTYQISTSTGTYALSVASGSSLDTIAADINGLNSGVTASVVAAGASGYRLQLATADGSSFHVDPTGSTTGSLLGGAIHSTGGTDASITVNGQTLTSSSNTITGLMPGVDVTLAADAKDSATITVSHDTQSLADKVKGMVDAVNSALDDISSLTSYDSSTKTAGLLSGDSTLRTVRGQLLDSITTGVNGQSLASVGIQVDKTGKVTFDSAKFTDAYNADPTGTAGKFAGTATWTDTSGTSTGSVTLHGSTWRTQAGSYAVVVDSTSQSYLIDGSAASVAGDIYTGATGTATDGLSLNITGDVNGTVTFSQGIAAKLESLSQRASNSTDGFVTTDIKGRQSDVTTMNKSIDDWDVRLANKQDALQKQFAALEVALGKMQSQASWLSGQIASLPSTSSGG